MSLKIPEVGHGRLYVPIEFKAPLLPEDLDTSKRSSISHLIKVISSELDLPDYDPSYNLRDIDPDNLQKGLCLGTMETKGKFTEKIYNGLAFSSKQFLCIARSPKDLAQHVYTRTLRSNETSGDYEQDRVSSRDTSIRSAIHALDDHVEKTESLIMELSDQLICLRALRRELKSPGYARYKMINLDILRRTASNIIHGHIELASLSLGWDQQKTEDLQQAARHSLYGLKNHNNARIKNWTRYVLMAGWHTRNQQTASRYSLKRTKAELDRLRISLSN